MDAAEADLSVHLPPGGSSSGAGAAAAPAGEPAPTAAEAAAAEPSWVEDVLKRQPWESGGQHAERVRFLRRVVEAMKEAGDLNEDNFRLLSGLFHSVRYLGCTYTPELESLLDKYDPELTAYIKKKRENEAHNDKQRQRRQQQPE